MNPILKHQNYPWKNAKENVRDYQNEEALPKTGQLNLGQRYKAMCAPYATLPKIRITIATSYDFIATGDGD